MAHYLGRFRKQGEPPEELASIMFRVQCFLLSVASAIGALVLLISNPGRSKDALFVALVVLLPFSGIFGVFAWYGRPIDALSKRGPRRANVRRTAAVALSLVGAISLACALNGLVDRVAWSAIDLILFGAPATRMQAWYFVIASTLVLGAGIGLAFWHSLDRRLQDDP